MPYDYPGRKARPHAADIHAAAQVARAVSFSIVFHKGPSQRFSETADDRREAFAIAARLDAEHGKHGRRAVVYGITPEGTAWPIPSAERGAA